MALLVDRWVCQKVTEPGTSSIPVQSALQRNLTGSNDRISQQIFDATLILARNGKLGTSYSVGGCRSLTWYQICSDCQCWGRLSHIEDAMHDTTLNMRPTAEGSIQHAFCEEATDDIQAGQVR